MEVVVVSMLSMTRTNKYIHVGNMERPIAECSCGTIRELNGGTEHILGTRSVVFSGKRDGLLLYFARIISPVWKLKFFTFRVAVLK